LLIASFWLSRKVLPSFKKLYFPNRKQHQDWLSRQGDILKTRGGKALIWMIEQLPEKTKTTASEKEKLLQYLKNNEHRMNYPAYLKRGFLIVSGAMEAVHRTVSQKGCNFPVNGGPKRVPKIY
jgi:hypothetical protein